MGVVVCAGWVGGWTYHCGGALGGLWFSGGRSALLGYVVEEVIWEERRAGCQWAMMSLRWAVMVCGRELGPGLGASRG